MKHITKEEAIELFKDENRTVGIYGIRWDYSDSLIDQDEQERLNDFDKFGIE